MEISSKVVFRRILFYIATFFSNITFNILLLVINKYNYFYGEIIMIKIIFPFFYASGGSWGSRVGNTFAIRAFKIIRLIFIQIIK